jgi:hypothetical protein
MISHVLIYPVLFKLYLNSCFCFCGTPTTQQHHSIFDGGACIPTGAGRGGEDHLALGGDSMAALRVCQLLATRSGDLPWLLISLLTTLKKQLNS